MKKIISKSIIAILITISISSCISIHSGYMANSASLNSANFSYVMQNIKGEATATYVLGIGGAARETLVGDAKKEMLHRNPLMSNQAFANITVNYATTYYYLFPVCTVTCTITADVVEFK